MILSILSNPTFTHLLELFFWMFGAFIIGLVYGRIISKKKTQNIVDFNIRESEDINLQEDLSQIRATKTFERGGREMIKTVPDIPQVVEVDTEKDDLKQINGIGATIENKLNTIGIYNFSQLSNLNKEDIESISKKIKISQGRIERANWVGQSKIILENNNK